jgi:hypothetical protein
MSRFHSGWLLAGIACVAAFNYFIPGKKVSAAGSNAEYTSLLTKAVRCTLPKYERYAADNIRFNGNDVSPEYRITHAFQILFDVHGKCLSRHEVPVDSIFPQEKPPVSNIVTTDDGVSHLFIILNTKTERGEYSALQEDFQRIPVHDNNRH